MLPGEVIDAYQFSRMLLELLDTGSTLNAVSLLAECLLDKLDRINILKVRVKWAKGLATLPCCAGENVFYVHLYFGKWE